MKNFKQFVNEGVRHLMTPKSEEEIKNAYSNIIKEINNPISLYKYEINNEFEQISELFKVSKEELHLITEDNNNWDLLDELFTKTIENNNKIVKIEVEETENEHGGVWMCWTDKKLAYWNSEEIHGISAWIFYKPSYINESFEYTNSPRYNKYLDEVNNAKVGDILDNETIYNYVQYLSEKAGKYEECFVDGDLGDRLDKYSNYILKEIPLNKIGLKEWDIYWPDVNDYKLKYLENKKYPPIVVDRYSNSENYYCIIDGTHRANALNKAGETSILAFVGN
jgi:hypothetical protein